MKLASKLSLLLLLTGCSSGPVVVAPTLPRAKVTEPAWPTLAACLDAIRRTPPGRVDTSRACARIDFENKLSPIFVLHALEVEIDGALLFVRHEPVGERGELADRRRFTVLLDQATPGKHDLRLTAWLLPDATVQPSLLGYRWEICSVHQFTLAPGNRFFLEMIVYEQRDGKTPVEESPMVRYLENGEKTAPGNGPDLVGAYHNGCPRPAPK